VLFLIAGEDRIIYGGDQNVTGGKPFKEWVLAQDNYDLSRFVFLGRLPPPDLAQLFALSDLHIYLTVPFVLSWSLLDALACGATVLASNTPPVREVIEPCVNGLLMDFFDVDGMAEQANWVLDDPQAYRHLGKAGVELVRSRYSLHECLPRVAAMFEETVSAHRIRPICS
jgi:glycosyltransferase involved in cell wall biosynthesis